jgi:hypothetical protein
MSSVKDTRKLCSRSIHDWSDARAEAQTRIDEALSKQDVDPVWANVQILDDEKRLESGESPKTALVLRTLRNILSVGQSGQVALRTQEQC